MPFICTNFTPGATVHGVVIDDEVNVEFFS
jgi:hypothetical protein